MYIADPSWTAAALLAEARAERAAQAEEKEAGVRVAGLQRREASPEAAARRTRLKEEAARENDPAACEVAAVHAANPIGRKIQALPFCLGPLSSRAQLWRRTAKPALTELEQEEPLFDIMGWQTPPE